MRYYWALYSIAGDKEICADSRAIQQADCDLAARRTLPASLLLQEWSKLWAICPHMSQHMPPELAHCRIRCRGQVILPPAHPNVLQGAESTSPGLFAEEAMGLPHICEGRYFKLHLCDSAVPCRSLWVQQQHWDSQFLTYKTQKKSCINCVQVNILQSTQTCTESYPRNR